MMSRQIGDLMNLNCIFDAPNTLYNEKAYANNVIARQKNPKPYKAESEIHCNCTDAEIAKSFIEDVEAVKDLLPQESEKISDTNLKIWEEIFKVESEDKE